MIGLLISAAAALPFGLRHVDEDLDLVPSPGQALARDASAFRRTALSAALAAGSAGLISGAMTSIFEVGAKPSLTDVVSDGLGIGLSSALVIGLTFGIYHAASPDFRIINWWLAARQKTPWRLEYFLDDAYHKTVLRQVGAACEFRHVILRDRLAAGPTDGQQRRHGQPAVASKQTWPGQALAQPDQHATVGQAEAPAATGATPHPPHGHGVTAAEALAYVRPLSVRLPDQAQAVAGAHRGKRHWLPHVRRA